MAAVTDRNRLDGLLAQANQDVWDAEIPARVPTRLLLAIDSLARNTPVFWTQDSEYLQTLLDENPGVTKIFKEYDTLTIAFAIRQARRAKKQ